MELHDNKLIFINMLKQQIGGSYLSNLDFIEDLKKIYKVELNEILILDSFWKDNGIHRIPKIDDKKIIFHNIWDTTQIPTNGDIKEIVSAIINNTLFGCIESSTIILGHEILLWLVREIKSRIKASKIFLIHHGTPTHSLSELNINFYNSFIENLKLVNASITVSEHLSSQLSKYSNINCICVPNYPKIDPPKKQKKNRKKIRLVQVSTFREIKRPFDGIQICQLLNKKGFDCMLSIIGFGAYCSSVEIPNGLEIDLIPYLGRKQLAKIISDSDFLLLPSSKEGLPRVVVEAMLCGTPPVVSTGANKSNIVTDKIDGLVFETGDIAHASKVILDYYNDHDKYITLVNNSLKRIVALRNERERGLKTMITQAISIEEVFCLRRNWSFP